MPILPNIFANFAFWVLEVPYPVANIIFKLAFVDLSIFPDEFSPPILEIIQILSFKLVFIA
jgi:hypothetical protein